MSSSGTPISPVTTTRPELTITAASINNEPVELDGTPTSPEEQRARANGSQHGTLENLNSEERIERDKLVKKRQTDNAIIQDLPQTPGAEEFGKSEDAEGSVANRRAQ